MAPRPCLYARIAPVVLQAAHPFPTSLGPFIVPSGRKLKSARDLEMTATALWSGEWILNRRPPGPEPRNRKTISRFSGFASGSKPTFCGALS